MFGNTYLSMTTARDMQSELRSEAKHQRLVAKIRAARHEHEHYNAPRKATMPLTSLITMPHYL